MLPVVSQGFISSGSSNIARWIPAMTDLIIDAMITDCVALSAVGTFLLVGLLASRK